MTVINAINFFNRLTALIYTFEKFQAFFHVLSHGIDFLKVILNLSFSKYLWSVIKQMSV